MGQKGDPQRVQAMKQQDSRSLNIQDWAMCHWHHVAVGPLALEWKNNTKIEWLNIKHCWRLYAMCDTMAAWGLTGGFT